MYHDGKEIFPIARARTLYKQQDEEAYNAQFKAQPVTADIAPYNVLTKRDRREQSKYRYEQKYKKLVDKIL